MTTTIHPAAFVEDGAELGTGVEIGPGAVIGPRVRIGDGTRVGSHALVTGWTTIGRGCRLHHGAVAGSPPQDLKYAGEPSYLEIGDHTELREYVTANLATEPGATTRIGSHCLLMAYAHVAHNCQIGDHAIIANAVQFAGYVTVEDWAIVGGGTVVHQFVRIGRHSIVGGGSRIAQDVAPFMMAAGAPPRCTGVNKVGLERRGFSRATRDALDRSYRLLFRDGLTVAEAAARMRERHPAIHEVEALARFAETSARGLTR
ncbi:MAG: acyl-ACP--UDP-N-acetylglucosamine O-acyltransferase [Candidatus Eisenbacteria bacterium]|uniref:Acyl-[acyl-carrier-protein]--UDP-N-acetylglucosamine O-acyltransferase n=1 Tax=Eiseniibacteriota bacterium TaxID=2212470 RepID=A0A9D6QPN3_UNCEI|nr:acyl-ACP--UDP-N-acetylglucosamine O-acyltransferase [Candidatus Eisenbacteria bacterium]MBI3540114.1 acyl-ACP--UDP-N-acetylglucosamine O-acyltransferase [Candidatus Eisenbacteria bacterium]